MKQDWVDDYWMQEALKLAETTPGTRHPNPKVACLIVSENVCIASGVTEPPPGRHAERVAFDAWNSKQNGTLPENLTVYVTLEPCCHYGKQPPCVDLFMQKQVKRIVISCLDPNPLVNGKSTRLLLAAGKEVRVGVQEGRARWQHAAFFSHLGQKTLFVGKWASSIDGQLYDDEGTSKWISGERARDYSKYLRSCFDAILIGAGTLLQDKPTLKGRDKDPTPIFFDPRAVLPPNPFLRSSFTVRSLEELWALTSSFESIFVEGGPHTLSLLLPRLDYLVVFTGNVFLGGTKGRMQAPWRLDSAKRWTLLTSITLNQDVCSIYKKDLESL